MAAGRCCLEGGYSMKTKYRCMILGALLLLVGWRGDAADLYKKTEVKGEVVLPAPAEIKALGVNCTSINLVGSDDSRQLIVTGTLIGGSLQDLTGNATYEVAD